LDQTGESTFKPREDAPRPPREKLTHGDAPGDTPPRKPGFKKKFGGKKSGKPGSGYRGKNPRPKT
ncbi:MAG TPA: hypothetical protein VHC39_07780, partial [Rhizomicrobium sp.]|nr:hypothetical protein [Rhizomicrobium sp.]